MAAKKSTKKSAAKTSTAKTSTRKTAAKKSTAKKGTAKKGTARKSTKKATAKKATRGSSSNAQLVVGSRVKEAARDADIRVGSDFADAFNAEVNEVLSRAIDRARSNGRATLRPGDL